MLNGIWIRSQDKNRLIFATNIYIDCYGSFVLVKANSHTIGEYRTKERALQLLDEMQVLINMSHNNEITRNRILQMPAE